MNKTAKNSIICLTGTIVMALVGFVSSMLLTQVLPTQVYAMYGLLSTFSTTVVTIATMGMDGAYTRFYYTNGYKHIEYLFRCLAVPAIICAAFSLLLLEPNHYLIKYIFEEDITTTTVAVIVAYIFISLISRFTHVSVRMKEHALNYVSSNFVAKSGFLLIIAGLYVTKKNISFFDVVVSFLIAASVAVFMNLIMISRSAIVTGSGTESINIGTMLRYGIPLVINNAMVLIIPLVEKIVIRELSGWEVLGVYTAAAMFSTVVLMLQNTLDNIWNPLVYKHFENEKHFKPIMHSFGLAVTIITTVGFALCILLRRWLVLILDSRYFEVYTITPAIVYAACFNVLTIVYSVGINVSKKTWHMMISPTIQFVVSIILCFALIPKLGLVGIGIASLISVAASRLYRIAAGLRSYDTGTSELKNYLMWAICVIVAILSMFLTSFAADLIMGLGVLALLLILVNKELFVIYKDFKHLLFARKK